MKAEAGVTGSPAPLGANLPNRFHARLRAFGEFHRLVAQYVPAIPLIKPWRDQDTKSRDLGVLSWAI